MGCGGSKENVSPDRPVQGGGPAAGGVDVGGTEKTKTFRERRLSISQKQEENTRPRRLSIYGSPTDETAQPSEVVSPCYTCGCKTMGGFEPVPGGSIAKINQDRGLAIYPFLGKENQGLFGVYDGHGRSGEVVSEFVLQNLAPALEEDRATMDVDPGRAMTQAYLRVDEDLAKHVDASVSGTTAVTCFIQDTHLWIANSGDSRAVVVRKVKGSNTMKAIDLTIDHKPDSPGEMKRILQMGGHVTPVSIRTSPTHARYLTHACALQRNAAGACRRRPVGARKRARAAQRCGGGEPSSRRVHACLRVAERSVCCEVACTHPPPPPALFRRLVPTARRRACGTTCAAWPWLDRLGITRRRRWVSSPSPRSQSTTSLRTTTPS